MSSTRLPSASHARSDLALPVVAANPKIRPSRSSRRRAIVLTLLHLIMIAHIAHGYFTGRTISPIEPSESMETLETGRLNAGFIFFALALAATLAFGRFLCGWGCHWIAYQDLCGWLLRKVGVKPRPLRSRTLVWVPLAVAFYMFVWPRLNIWWRGLQVPELSNHLTTTEFWKTFPGPVMIVVSILFAGFAIVYFLGNKGFCTYACPYGAFFGLLDKLSPASIRVTDDCRGCGHCTATCTSNVRVHEQVRDFGMVVDPGCMKTLDCVSVCPNNALYFGLGRPAVIAHRRPTALGSKLRAAFTLPEECLLLILFAFAFFSIRGLYELFPLLASLGIAGIFAFLTLIALRLIYRPNVRLHNFILKRSGSIHPAGVGTALLASALFALTFHSGLVQYHTRLGYGYYESKSNAPESATPPSPPNAPPSQPPSSKLARSAEHLRWVDRWGLRDTVGVSMKLGWIHTVRSEPLQAERYFRRAIELAPDQAPPHFILGNLLMSSDRAHDAREQYAAAAELQPDFAPAHYNLGLATMAAGDPQQAVTHYLRAVDLAPDDPEVRNNLGLALAAIGQIDRALRQFERALTLRPDFPEPHFNLARLHAAADRPDRAQRHLQDACRLDQRYCEFRLGPPNANDNTNR